jgi:hypothetical protein
VIILLSNNARHKIHQTTSAHIFTKVSNDHTPTVKQKNLIMKLTLHSSMWYTMFVVSTYFATTLSLTVLDTASDGTAATAHSLGDTEGADHDGNIVASSLRRRLPTFTGSVTGFDLMDVTSKPNKLWRTLSNNVYVAGANRPYSIKATVAGQGIGSVFMQLSNNPVKYENLAPYGLCGDDGVDFASCGMTGYGSYTISATACSGANGQGACSAPKTIHFRIGPAYVAGFDLIDATNKPSTVWTSLSDYGYEPAIAYGPNLPSISTNVVAYGPNRPYSIRANVVGDGVGSVVMQLDNNPVKYENLAPYGLCGDDGVDFVSCGMTGYGSYTISAKACSGTNGEGPCGESTSVYFEIAA